MTRPSGTLLLGSWPMASCRLGSNCFPTASIGSSPLAVRKSLSCLRTMLIPIYSGMSMVLKQLNDFLTANGLEPIDAVGKQFDPNLHEAIGHEPSNKVPEGRVIRQTRRGYRLKDRLLRPAAVVVSSGAARSSNE